MTRETAIDIVENVLDSYTMNKENVSNVVNALKDVSDVKKETASEIIRLVSDKMGSFDKQMYLTPDAILSDICVAIVEKYDLVKLGK